MNLASLHERVSNRVSSLTSRRQIRRKEEEEKFRRPKSLGFGKRTFTLTHYSRVPILTFTKNFPPGVTFLLPRSLLRQNLAKKFCHCISGSAMPSK